MQNRAAEGLLPGRHARKARPQKGLGTLHQTASRTMKGTEPFCKNEAAREREVQQNGAVDVFCTFSAMGLRPLAQYARKARILPGRHEFCQEGTIFSQPGDRLKRSRHRLFKWL